MGFRKPQSWNWFLVGPLLSIAVFILCAFLAWMAFGSAPENWFTRHALALREPLARVPSETSITARFLMVTIPAMIFSPLAEEFLFRGFIQHGLSRRWTDATGIMFQSLLFAFVHLALFIGAIAYAFYSLLLGNSTRFIILIGCLIAYYFLVLHKGLKKEIQRRKDQNN